MTRRRIGVIALTFTVTAAVILLVVGLLGGAALVLTSAGGESDFEPTGDDWVVVTFPAEAGAGGLTWVRMMRIELAADRALGDAAAGALDGNEVGQGTYDLYFVGDDAAAMWEVLRPIMDDAPVRWSSARLQDTLDDAAPVVVTNDAE